MWRYSKQVDVYKRKEVCNHSVTPSCRGWTAGIPRGWELLNPLAELTCSVCSFLWYGHCSVREGLTGSKKHFGTEAIFLPLKLAWLTKCGLFSVRDPKCCKQTGIFIIGTGYIFSPVRSMKTTQLSVKCCQKIITYRIVWYSSMEVFTSVQWDNIQWFETLHLIICLDFSRLKCVDPHSSSLRLQDDIWIVFSVTLF